jgi:hypothetical protein
MGYRMASWGGAVQAQAPGQNFDVVKWERMPRPLPSVPPQYPDFHDFNNVTSTSYTQTNVGGPFVKLRNDTYLWVILNLDFIPATANSSFMGVFIDGAPIVTTELAGPANLVLTCSISEISPQLSAGLKQCWVYVAVMDPSAPCNFITTECSFTVMEVAMPNLQT